MARLSHHLAELEKQHATILQGYVQQDVKVEVLEVEIARYREDFEGLHLQVQQQEHRGKLLCWGDYIGWELFRSQHLFR